MTPIEFVDHVASFTLYDESIGTPDYQFLLNDSEDLQALVRLAKQIQEQI
jgi:hypothetical protein